MASKTSTQDELTIVEQQNDNIVQEEVTTDTSTINLEDIVRDVLDTRPAVMAAKMGPATTSFERDEMMRRSLPASARTRRSHDSGHRRSSSLHGKLHRKETVIGRKLNPQTETSDIVIDDIESFEDDNTNNELSFQRKKTLRKSSAYLKNRLAEHRKITVTSDRVAAARTSCWADLKYVKWPKIKSRLQVILSQELWKGHLKEIEGHFGTTVVSYFIFLRWLFIMNIVIFLLWFAMICAPQFYYQSQTNAKQLSNITCLLPSLTSSLTSNYTCTNESTSRLNNVMVYSIPTHCLQGLNTRISIRECEINGDEGTKEGPIVRTVSSTLVNQSCLPVSQSSVDIENDYYEMALINATVYTVCIGVTARIEWYQHILDFISGTGFFNETLLFQGVYPNSSVGGYNISLAFLFVTGVIYVLGVFLLVFKMGQAFNESYVEFSSTRKINFCNKLFTAWDFNITEPKTAKLRQIHIRTDFQEELLDLHAREKKRTWKEIVLVVFIRIFTNLFVLVALVGAGTAIFYSASYELQILTTGVEIPLIGEYLSAIVISILNAVLPFIFQLVAKIEQYKTTTGAVRITLLRTVMVRLSSLIVLLGSLFLVLSNCTTLSTETSNDECTISSFTSELANSSENANITTECPSCWETFIGQQFYKLGITNFFLSLFATIIIETGRHIMSRVVVRIKWKNLGQKLGRFVTKGNFNIPKSILDLIYTQSLLWLGFLFSPLLPFIVLVTSFLVFYVKKYSLILNLEPNKKGFQRSAKTNFLFLFLMLLALFASVIPVLYAAVQLRPSESCGPFRGQSSMYQSISDLVNSGSCATMIAFDFFSSFAFIVPLIIFLILLCYAMFIILRARDARFELVKKQLILEGANVTHIVGNLNDALQELSSKKKVVDEHTLPLSEVIRRRSRALSKTDFQTETEPVRQKFLSPHSTVETFM